MIEFHLQRNLENQGTDSFSKNVYSLIPESQAVVSFEMWQFDEVIVDPFRRCLKMLCQAVCIKNGIFIGRDSGKAGFEACQHSELASSGTWWVVVFMIKMRLNLTGNDEQLGFIESAGVIRHIISLSYLLLAIKHRNPILWLDWLWAAVHLKWGPS